MNEISVFKIVFDYDLSRLKDLPKDVDKILKEIQSNISTEISDKIAKGVEAIVPNIRANNKIDLTQIIVDTARKKLGDILINIGLGRTKYFFNVFDIVNSFSLPISNSNILNFSIFCPGSKSV